MPSFPPAVDHTADHTADRTLTSEREHLAESRTALRRMREHTAGLQAFGGDHVSTQHLKQALYRRMKALEDDPSVPLFFGRLDYDASLGAETDETLYIGRRHVTSEAGGEPMVIDWRAAMSLPFYRARPGDPMRVSLRRRFGFAAGRLTAYEDEDLRGPPVGQSAILESEIERPRTGPMRDIVATIQPEQDSIVRTPLSESVCIQGAPGTGKTAVGLHRAAYLLYAYREQLSRSGVLVVGPNDSFLSYIGDVLPALGEIDATQATVSSLATAGTGAEIRGLDTVPAALIKGDARMAEVLRRAVWSHVRRPEGTLVVPRGAYQWRVGSYLVTESSTNWGPAGCGTRRVGPCCRSGWPTRCCSGWRPREIRRTIGCRTRWRAVVPYATTPTLSGRLSIRRSWCSPSSPSGVPGGAGRRGAGRPGAEPDHDGQARPIRPHGSLVAGRRDLDRRGRRPPDPDAEPGPRDRGRGAGPVGHAAARGRPAGQYRLGHRAR